MLKEIGKRIWPGFISSHSTPNPSLPSTPAGVPGLTVSIDELLRLRDQAVGLGFSPQRKARSVQAGGYLSPYRGRGMEFEEVRAYQPGDDIRNMDWRVTARTGRPHTKLFREERERPVLFLVDLGPSMAFGARVALKSVVAARAAALRVPFLEEVLALQPAAGERKALRHRWTRVAPWLAWLLLTFAATQPQWLGEPVSLPTSGRDLLLAFIAWRLLRQSSGTSAWESQCDPHLLARLLVHRTSHHRLPLLLLAVGWTLAVFALAGPAWQKLPQPVFQAQAARVMVLDLSPSMNAPDLRPSRIDRARFKLLDLLARFREGQTGLVVFAGASFVVSPLTDDTKTIAALLPALAPELMPAPGDHAHAALRMADDLLSQAGIHGQGEIILVTDGYDDPAAVLETVNALRAHGRRVSVLAVGTREGAPIPLPDGGFLKDAAGAIVLPRLDSAALTELARQGDGRFARLSVDDRDIEALLSGQERPQEVREESSRQRSMDRWREEGPWLVFQPSWIEG